MKPNQRILYKGVVYKCVYIKQSMGFETYYVMQSEAQTDDDGRIAIPVPHYERLIEDGTISVVLD